MKKNKLYTANRHNIRGLFSDRDVNLFDGISGSSYLNTPWSSNFLNNAQNGKYLRNYGTSTTGNIQSGSMVGKNVSYNQPNWNFDWNAARERRVKNTSITDPTKTTTGGTATGGLGQQFMWNPWTPSNEKLESWANDWYNSDKTQARIKSYNDKASAAREAGNDKKAAKYEAKAAGIQNSVDSYINSKNAFGISKQMNPFSKMNIGTTAGAGMAAVAPILGSAISGNKSTTVGSGISSIGSTVGGALMAANPILGGAVTLGSNLLGGLWNAAFGTEWHDENIADVENNISNMRNQGNLIAGANTNADFLDRMKNINMGYDFDTDYIGDDGWFTSKAERKAKKLTAMQNTAREYVKHGIMEGAENADQTQDDLVMSNFIAAYGGPLYRKNKYSIGGELGNMDATNLGLAYDSINARNYRSDALSRGFLVPSTAGTLFATGGGIHIKHPGRLTALKKRTGKTEAELWAEGRPDVRKMITFARNARKFKHSDGGPIILGEGGPSWTNSVGTVTTRGFVPRYVSGYSGGIGGGAGTGTLFEYIPQRTDEVAKDTIWLPVTETFNDAFARAVRQGLPEFEFNGQTYTTEMSNNPNWKAAGDARQRIVDLLPIEVEKKKTNYRADGGPLFIGNPYCGGGTMFDFGGNLATHGGDYSTGLTHIDEGSQHELNPNGGVQVGVDSEGTPNLVEENETIWNDYVFSNRLTMDQEAKDAFHIGKKTDYTYAEYSKKLEKEAAERPNDAISKRGLEVQMEDLREHQERQKAEMEAQEAEEAFDALAPEEKVAVMQDVAAQEQAAQEQAMQEQAMAEQQAQEAAMAQQMPQQQVSPEELAALQQQEAMQQVPQEGMAYGGNLLKDGGSLNWLRKHHADIPNIDVIAAAMDKYIEAHPSKVKIKNDPQPFMNAYYFVAGKGVDLSQNTAAPNREKRIEEEGKQHYQELLGLGIPREIAFDLAFNTPTLSTKGLSRDSQAANQIAYADSVAAREAMKELLLKAPAKAFEDVMIQSNTITPATNNTNSYDLTDFSGGNIPGVTIGTGEYQFVPGQQNQHVASGSPAVTDTKTAEELAAQKNSQSAQSETPVTETAAAKSTTNSNTGLKNVNSWKDKGVENKWGKFVKPGLNAFIDDYEKQIKEAPNEYQKQQLIDKMISEFNTMQQSYNDYILPNAGKSRYAYDSNVDAHQQAFNAMHGNEGFYTIDEQGNVSNIIAQELNNPGNTGDNPTGGWHDGYNGRQTELRNFGYTAYGNDDFYKDIIDRFKKLGVDYSPYSEWSDKDGNMLYRLDRSKDNPSLNIVPERASLSDVVGIPTLRQVLGLPDASQVDAKKETPAPADEKKGEWVLKPVLKNETNLGMYGPLVTMGMQLAGVGKPKYEEYDKALNMMQTPHVATYQPIGDYIRYSPMDIWAAQNRADANARATDRYIMNSSNPWATKMAGLIASNYADQLGRGETFRQSQMYNDDLAKQVAEFNRGTNIQNANAFNQVSQFNTGQLNAFDQARANMAYYVANAKENARSGWYNSLYGNVGDFFQNLANYEKEKRDRNQVAKMAASGIYKIADGSNPIFSGLVTREWIPAAKGGKLKRRKNKRDIYLK